jgi:polysaccharide biosynthesis protein PslH
MRILFVSLFLPMEKAYHAGARHVFESIRRLSATHSIDLVARLQEGEEPHLRELSGYCGTILPFSYPAVVERDLSGIARLAANYLRFSRFADRIIARGGYDVVQVEWVETAILIRRHGTPMVLNAHDVITKPAQRKAGETRGLRRIAREIGWRAIRTVELSIARRFDRVLTVSDYDKKFLLSLDPALRVETVPIAAGMDFTGREIAPQPDLILFLASYRYRPVNVSAALWFHREVLPLVRRKVPEARFVIAGYGPPEELTRLAETDPLTEVPGFVDDLERCHREAAVFVAPILSGGGIIVKILDAMAAGRPVVTTPYGNEGIGAEPGRDLLVAETPETFAAAVVSLLRDREFARRVGESGRSFVAANYSVEAVTEKQLSVLRQLGERVG